MLHKVEIWTVVMDALQTDSQTLKDSATQLLIKYKSSRNAIFKGYFGKHYVHLYMSFWSQDMLAWRREDLSTTHDHR